MQDSPSRWRTQTGVDGPVPNISLTNSQSLQCSGSYRSPAPSFDKLGNRLLGLVVNYDFDLTVVFWNGLGLHG